MVEEMETEEPAAVLDLTERRLAASDPSVQSITEQSTAPGVDDLQARLAELQGAMHQLQSGDLDAAEAAIDALENAMAATIADAKSTSTL